MDYWNNVPKTIRKEVAKHARKLAFQYLNGKGPDVVNETFKTCLAGAILKPCFSLPVGRYLCAVDELDNLVEYALLTISTTKFCEGNKLAPVFPLLATADALEEM